MHGLIPSARLSLWSWCCAGTACRRRIMLSRSAADRRSLLVVGVGATRVAGAVIAVDRPADEARDAGDGDQERKRPDGGLDRTSLPIRARGSPRRASSPAAPPGAP